MFAEFRGCARRFGPLNMPLESYRGCFLTRKLCKHLLHLFQHLFMLKITKKVYDGIGPSFQELLTMGLGQND